MPTPSLTARPFGDVFTRLRLTAVLLADSALRCWGLNADGQLGYGNTNVIGDDETPASAGDVPYR